LTQEGIELGAALAGGDQLLPPLIILPGQKESGEIGDLGALLLSSDSQILISSWVSTLIT
jgi:hypothetical protein